MRERPELRREIDRLVLCLTRCPLNPYQRRELEGSLAAIAWVYGIGEHPPTVTALPRYEYELVNELERAARDAEAQELALATPAPAGAATFLDRSQPKED